MTETFPIRTLIISVALVLMTVIGSCNAKDAYIRVKAFEMGYCQDTLKGTSMAYWTQCPAQVGD